MTALAPSSYVTFNTTFTPACFAASDGSGGGGSGSGLGRSSGTSGSSSNNDIAAFLRFGIGALRSGDEVHVVDDDDDEATDEANVSSGGDFVSPQGSRNSSSEAASAAAAGSSISTDGTPCFLGVDSREGGQQGKKHKKNREEKNRRRPGEEPVQLVFYMGVARGTEVVVDCGRQRRVLAHVVSEVLAHVPAHVSRYSLGYGRTMALFLVAGELTYFAVADAALGRRRGYEALAELERSFQQRMGRPGAWIDSVPLQQDIGMHWAGSSTSTRTSSSSISSSSNTTTSTRSSSSSGGTGFSGSSSSSSISNRTSGSSSSSAAVGGGGGGGGGNSNSSNSTSISRISGSVVKCKAPMASSLKRAEGHGREEGPLSTQMHWEGKQEAGAAKVVHMQWLQPPQRQLHRSRSLVLISTLVYEQMELSFGRIFSSCCGKPSSGISAGPGVGGLVGLGGQGKEMQRRKGDHRKSSSDWTGVPEKVRDRPPEEEKNRLTVRQSLMSEIADMLKDMDSDFESVQDSREARPGKGERQGKGREALDTSDEGESPGIEARRRMQPSVSRGGRIATRADSDPMQRMMSDDSPDESPDLQTTSVPRRAVSAAAQPAAGWRRPPESGGQQAAPVEEDGANPDAQAGVVAAVAAAVRAAGPSASAAITVLIGSPASPAAVAEDDKQQPERGQGGGGQSGRLALGSAQPGAGGKGGVHIPPLVSVVPEAGGASGGLLNRRHRFKQNLSISLGDHSSGLSDEGESADEGSVHGGGRMDGMGSAASCTDGELPLSPMSRERVRAMRAYRSLRLGPVSPIVRGALNIFKSNSTTTTTATCTAHPSDSGQTQAAGSGASWGQKTGRFWSGSGSGRVPAAAFTVGGGGDVAVKEAGPSYSEHQAKARGTEGPFDRTASLDMKGGAGGGSEGSGNLATTPREGASGKKFMFGSFRVMRRPSNEGEGPDLAAARGALWTVGGARGAGGGSGGGGGGVGGGWRLPTSKSRSRRQQLKAHQAFAPMSTPHLKDFAREFAMD